VVDGLYRVLSTICFHDNQYLLHIFNVPEDLIVNNSRCTAEIKQGFRTINRRKCFSFK
jgi:hypothetical protein